MGRAERSHEARARDTHNLGRLLDIRHALRNSEWVETNIARARGDVKGVRDSRDQPAATRHQRSACRDMYRSGRVVDLDGYDRSAPALHNPTSRSRDVARAVRT